MIEFACNRSSALVWFAGLMLVMAGTGCDTRRSTGSDKTGADSESAQADAGTVQLEIDFKGNKSDLTLEIPCTVQTTVYELLETAQQRAELTFEATGSGETAFVSSIGGVKNQGATGNNWVFHINDQLGDQSCGTYPVQAGDHVRWSFGKYPQ